jgi:16S rRNA (uracil1498-N3)-methyltransferase
MPRFFVPKEFVKGNSIYITGKEAHHILDVMRLKVSDEVLIFDGSGKEYAGVVKAAGRKSLEVHVKSVREPLCGMSPSITLIQAIPKKDKMDYIVEKSTELGVFAIVPVTTERTIPEWSAAKRAAVVERWQKIAMEAAKQCGRPDIPNVSPIVSIGEAVGELEGYDLKLAAILSDRAIKLKDALRCGLSKNVAVAIGPEGDFTMKEGEDFLKAGFKIVNLGPRVLKSNTAALAVLSMINYEYTD